MELTENKWVNKMTSFPKFFFQIDSLHNINLIHNDRTFCRRPVQEMIIPKH